MTVIISHPDCLLHNAEIQHPECPERLKIITKVLASSELGAKLSYEEAPLATETQLYRVHDKEYIDHLFKLTLSLVISNHDYNVILVQVKVNFKLNFMN